MDNNKQTIVWVVVIIVLIIVGGYWYFFMREGAAPVDTTVQEGTVMVDGGAAVPADGNVPTGEAVTP